MLEELKNRFIKYLYKRYTIDRDFTKDPKPSFNFLDDILFTIWFKINDRRIEKLNEKRHSIIEKLTPHREDENWVWYDTTGIPEFMGDKKIYVLDKVK